MNEYEDDAVFAKFLNYMKRALYNRTINYYRDLGKNRFVEDNYDYFYEPTYEVNQEEYINTRFLNAKEMLVLALHFEGGMTYSEISEITRENMETVKKRGQRAVDKLRKKLEE